MGEACRGRCEWQCAGARAAASRPAGPVPSWFCERSQLGDPEKDCSCETFQKSSSTFQCPGDKVGATGFIVSLLNCGLWAAIILDASGESGENRGERTRLGGGTQPLLCAALLFAVSTDLTVAL